MNPSRLNKWKRFFSLVHFLKYACKRLHVCDKIRAFYVSAYKAYDNACIRSTYLMFLINLFLTIVHFKSVLKRLIMDYPIDK